MAPDTAGIAGFNWKLTRFTLITTPLRFVTLRIKSALA